MEEVMILRKGGGEARSLRAVCDVCEAHGDRAAVGVHVDKQGKIVVLQLENVD